MAEEEGRYEIASVISRSFETIGANFVLFAGLALILTGVPSFALDLWLTTTNGTVAPTRDPNVMFSAAYMMPVIAGWLVSVVTGAILQAALTRATVMHLSGEKPGFAQCLAVGFAMILPMIAIGILVSIGVGLAMLLFIIPGIILWLCWSVVVPVYVQEKVGIFEAFGRSLFLTRGARWRIFLTLLLVCVGIWLLSIPAGMLMAGVAASGSVVATLLITSAIGALGSMVMVAVQSCIYVELRDVKEGIAPSDLEAIFA